MESVGSQGRRDSTVAVDIRPKFVGKVLRTTLGKGRSFVLWEGMRDNNNRGLRIIAAVLFGLAALISAYLMVQKLKDGPIAGCGVSCDRVLGSSFAYLVPNVPVTAPAIVIYGILIFGLLSRARGARAEAWEVVMYVGALIVIGSAVWFTGIQVVKLQQFCVWCMTAHFLGSAASVMILLRLRPAQKELLVIGVGVAAMALGSMSALQYFWKQKTTQTVRFGAAGALGSGKVVSFGPELELRLGDVPFRGNPESPNRMVLVFDYTCSTCRRTHKFLKRAEKRYGLDNYLVVMCPAPLHPNCNKYYEKEIPSRRHACKIASTALAVWYISPEKFFELDHWIIETGGEDDPPDISDVRAKAEELVGKDKLAKALANEKVANQIDRQIEMNTKVFAWAVNESKVMAMPKMIMNNGTVETGAVGNEFDFYKILEAGLGIKRLK